MFTLIDIVDDHLVLGSTHPSDVAKRLEALRIKCLFVIDEGGILLGSITDGDLRRSLHTSLDQRNPSTAYDICNKRCVSFQSISYQGRRNIDLPTTHEIVPIVNGRKIVQLAVQSGTESNLSYSPKSALSESVYVIAEIGNNHNGSLETAKQLVLEAVEAGANAVKFQLRNLDQLYRTALCESTVEDLAVEYTRDLLARIELTVEEHERLFEYCKQFPDLDYICTPWDESSVEALDRFGINTFKIASADLTNDSLIRRVIATGKPIILSTGMSTEDEIDHAVRILRHGGVRFTLLHTNSTYPAPFSDLNLKYLNRLALKHDSIGYSGHERGYYPTLAAVALGAKVIERHITLSRDMEGPDHSASLEPSDFKEMVDAIKIVSKSLGRGGPREISQGELINRENLGKSIVAALPIRKGDIFTEKNLTVRSPGQGLCPQKLTSILGRASSRAVRKGDFLYESDLRQAPKANERPSFKRPWGVPVRFHDAEALLNVFNPDLIEYHLSYRDIDRVDTYIKTQVNPVKNITVHAPEVFEESHLLDLCSEDENYRELSIENMLRTIRVTKILSKFHNIEAPIKVITNVGGFSRDRFLDSFEKERRLRLFGDSLTRIKMRGIEIVPQTMAPFPWHFGGQRYQNLFMHPSDIKDAAEAFGLRVCLDISHAALYCHEFNIEIRRYISEISPYVCHLHISDSFGSNGEGLQINEGQLDFASICKEIDDTLPQISFVPEVWQGHKDFGGGFYTALKRLEAYFRNE